MSLLGIDVGTTGCKASVFSVDGAILSSVYNEYPALRNSQSLADPKVCLCSKNKICRA